MNLNILKKIAGVFVVLMSLFGSKAYTQVVELSTQTGHTNSIMHIVFNNDGHLLASSDLNNKINIWHIPTGGQMSAIYLEKSIGQISQLVFSPDSKYLIVLTKLNKIITWNIKESKIESEFNLPYTAAYIAVGSSSDKILVCGNGLFLFDFKTNEVNLISSKTANYAQYFKNENAFKVLFNNGSVETLDKSGKLSDEGLNSKIEKVFAYKFFSAKNFNIDVETNQLIVSSAFKISSYNKISGKKNYSVSSTYYDEPFNNIDISTSNNLLLGANGDGRIYAINLKNGKTIEKLKGHLSDVYDVTFSPDEKMFASCSKDRSILIWDTKTLKPVRRLFSRAFPITCLDASEDGKYLVFGNEIGFSRVLDLESVLLEMNSVRNHSDKITDIAFFDNDSLIVSCANDNSICVLATNPFIQLDEKIVKKAHKPIFFAFRMLQHFGFYVPAYCFADTMFVDHQNSQIRVEGHYDKKPNVTISDKPKKNGKIRTRTDISYYKPVFYFNTKKSKIQKIKDSKMARNLQSIDLPDSFDFYNLQFGHKERISGFSRLRNYNILATSSYDATIKLWDIKTKKLLVTIIPIDRDKKVLITADNFYLAPKDALNAIGFKYGDQYFPPDQFDIQYNRPDIVHHKLGIASSDLVKAYHAAYKKRLKKMNFTEEMIGGELHLPEIILPEMDNLGLTTTNKYFNFDVIAYDSNYKLDRLNVYLNDVPIYGVSGIDLRKQNSDSLMVPVNIELASGKNKIQVSVLNQKGAESLKETYEVDFQNSVQKPDLYLVTIGTSNYKDERFNLSFAAKDANDLSLVFNENKDVFGHVYNKTLIDKDVTKENILKVKEFLNKAGRDDVIVVFIAGHGLLDENFTYYFGTYDIDFNHPSINGISYDDIETLLDGVKAIKKLLLMDTCHSGELDKDEIEVVSETPHLSESIAFRAAGVGVRQKEGFGLNNTSELMKELFTDLRKGTGSTVLSSAGGAEYAMEGKSWNNGLFTWCLLDGLQNKKADLNKDGKVMISELQSYLRSSVETVSEGKQTPTSRLENISMDFRIW